MLQTADGGGHFTSVTLRPVVTISAGDPDVALAIHAEASRAVLHRGVGELPGRCTSRESWWRHEARMLRAAALTSRTALLVGVQVAAPAAACACGGAAPPIDGGEVSVDREIAMVRWERTPVSRRS